MRRNIVSCAIVGLCVLSQLSPATAASTGVSTKTVIKKPAVSKSSSSSSKTGTSNAKISFPYTLSITDDWQKQWKIVTDANKMDSLTNATVQKENDTVPSFLRIRFPLDSGDFFTAINYKHALGGLYGSTALAFAPQTELYAHYAVRLPKNFDLKRGGSLPGLFTGAPGKDSSAWVRVVWNDKGALSLHGGFSRKNSQPSNVIESTAVLPADGQWHRIGLHTRLNTHPSKANGLLELSLDGKKVISNASMIFPSRTQEGWNGFLLDTFSGTPGYFSVSAKDEFLDIGGFMFGTKPLQP